MNIKAVVDAEIDRRERYGAALGRAWAPLKSIKATRSFKEFCALISETSVWDEVDFIVLNEAWNEIKRLRATPPNVGRAGENGGDDTPQGGAAQ